MSTYETVMVVLSILTLNMAIISQIAHLLLIIIKKNAKRK